MRKIVLTFGLIAGAMLSLFMILTMPFHDRIGFDTGLVLGYTGMVLAFLMIFVGIKTYRDNVGGGSVSFGRAFSVGLLITIIATVCYVATWEVILYKFAPDFMTKYAAHMVESAKKAGKSDAEVAAIAKEMAQETASYNNPFVNVAYTFIEPSPVGLVFTVLAAWVFSRRRREPVAARA